MQLARNFNKTLRRSALKRIFARHLTSPQSRQPPLHLFKLFSLGFFFLLLALIEIPQPQPHLASPLPTSTLLLPTWLRPIFIIAAIIWQMLLSPAPVSASSALPGRCSCSLPAPRSLLSLFLLCGSLSLPQLASAVPGQRLLFVLFLHLRNPSASALPHSTTCSSSSSSSFPAAAIYLIGCLRARSCCAPPRDQP